MIELKNKYQQIRDNYQYLIGKKESLDIQFKKNSDNLKEIEIKETLYQKCSVFLQKSADIFKTRHVEQIETVVTQGLHEILGNVNLQFKVIYEAKKNAIGIEFKIYNSALKETYDIINSFGGGIADIVAILLRVFFLYKSGIRKVLVLDETGKFISNTYQENFSNFLKTISEKLGIQIILISHKKEVIKSADKVIKLRKEQTKTVIDI